ncbi:MAG: branched-chain amino acid transaminase [Acidobacteriota bacterium]|nr:branched-chain amino acid transaminase [Acidobacteriota bacterium]
MAGFPGTGKIWMNGTLVDWADAKIHVAAHVVHYGSGVFEGARCYDSPKGAACFRIDAHVRRLFDSARTYRMAYPITPAQLQAAILETIRANALKDCYIRPLMYRGYDSLGVNPSTCPVDLAILVWPMGRYLGADALEAGVDVRVSSWTRMAPNTFPSTSKCNANYANSALIKMEALADGYAEAIALDVNGFVSEASGANVFLVRDNVIFTPTLGSSILQGITRDSIITLARHLGFEVRETTIPREFLYTADELFFVGTAAEVTPIRSVDRLTIGTGKRGPVTEAVQRAYFDLINGEIPDTWNWLTYVYPADAARREPAGARTAKGH